MKIIFSFIFYSDFVSLMWHIYKHGPKKQMWRENIDGRDIISYEIYNCAPFLSH